MDAHEDEVDPDFGVFPPGESVHVDGAEFRRVGGGYARQKIAVFDIDLNDEGPFAYAPADLMTGKQAGLWLKGIRAGIKLGEARGRREL